MEIQFWGAARTVTGSKHLLHLDNGKKILLDCGLFQGEGKETFSLNSAWGFEPSEIDIVLLSHAHIDHTGLLPKLVKDGFNGPIYATAATIDLCNIMLLDSARIQESDLKFVNKRRMAKRQELLEPLYDEDDAKKTLSLMREIPHKKSIEIDDYLTLSTFDNGHILGSVALFLEIKTKENKILKLAFTGDIGRECDAILNKPVPFPQADYIISESTYGDRLHEAQENVEKRLLEIITRTCIEKQGKIIIPAFSVDRTQELIYALDRLYFFKKLPVIDVYVDSPLSVKATQAMGRHKENFNPEILEYITKDGDPFCFPNLHYVKEVEESKKINSSKKPCIIISASGMAEAGRIKHHLRNNIENENNTILLVGYASPGSLAGRIKAGNPFVKIFGEEFEVKANVEVMENFSAHGDYKEMIDYLSHQDETKVKKLFLVHGEYDTQLAFAEKLKAVGFKHIEIPQKGVKYSIII